MNPYGGPGPGVGQSADAYMFPGWGSVQSGYQGSSPYGPQGKPTWMGAASQLASPFYRDPYWGNPVDNNSAAFNSFATKPFDAAAWIGQRIAMPAVTFGMASGMFSGAGRALGQGLGRGLLGGGMAGSLLGGGLGVIGSFGLPLAIGAAMAHAADSAFFQPYIRTRQSTDDIMRDFSGVTFGGGVGNSISGRGLNAYSSASIARGIDRFGVNDMTFSPTQMHSIAGMGMRAGLFDDVGSDQILSRAKDIASQVKLLVSISKDPNIQTAIEQLAQLRAGGASISGGVNSVASRAFSQMGYQASQAGVSVQQLMAATQQGQYMFQANGMTPYLGALAAGNVYAGFSSAFRTGNLSSSLLARMGGLTGATNSVMGAQLAAAQTPYNQLSLYNQAFGGAGPGGSYTSVAQTFGGLASQNPLKAAGGLLLYGPAMMSKQSREGGSRDMETQAIEMLRSHGVQPSGGGGRFSPEQIAMAWQQMGMSPDQVRAAAADRAASSDPATLSARMAAIHSQGREQMMQYVTQEGLYDGPLGRATTAVRRFSHSVHNSINDNLVYPVTDTVGRSQDWVANTWNDMFFGGTLPKRPNFSGGKRIHGGSGVNVRDTNGNVIDGRSDALQGLYDRLNREADRNSPLGELARKIMGGQKDSKTLAQFARDAGLDDVLKSMENGPELYNQFAKDIVDPKVVWEDGKLKHAQDPAFSLPYSVGTDGSLKIAGQARELILDAETNGLSLGTDMDSLLARGKYTELRAQLSKYTPAQRAAAIKYDATYASRNGYNDRTGHLDGQKFNMDFNESQGHIAGMIQRSMQETDRAQKELDNAQTGGDWSSFTKTMGTFDDAVDRFANAVSAMPGASPISTSQTRDDRKMKAAAAGG